MHKQLTFEQRHYINIARNNDKSMRTIAKDLNVSHCNGPINLDTFQATFFNSAIF
ncbi:helix-turn-helix domain-containing protein [Bathymodiolus azoricus thioautotrophic gill symbiont]|uniref:Transposase IS30-like HTH domain-containing protein n=1 Tax=Bathymodiolus azoricus thioautotrophic gill symbiont TaxID=235205 RepID=A0A1H6MDU8_9GAMM|nr:helix-turn-helix domain-containing protein [Bathymodiolus azoricus thioautotrophic gill symbiont]SEH99694.1 hypothetical protein BAZSYMA_ACONTIG273710_0 [Bathymodiolus azoricus thioautotrophic gill symbiont]